MESNWSQTLSHDIWSRPLTPPPKHTHGQNEDRSTLNEIWETVRLTWRLIQDKRKMYFKLKQI